MTLGNVSLSPYLFKKMSESSIASCPMTSQLMTWAVILSTFDTLSYHFLESDNIWDGLDATEFFVDEFSEEIERV